MSDRIANVLDHVPAFSDYLRRHPAWGAFHVVLDDGNTEQHFMDFCACETAEEHGLHDLLRRMTRTQREKLRKACR